MANGRCRMHGGNAARGRDHGRFVDGRHTKLALAERAAAKALRKTEKLVRADAAHLAMREVAGVGEPGKLDEIVAHLAELDAEAFALETGWIKRHHPEAFAKLLRMRRRRKKPTTAT